MWLEKCLFQKNNVLIPKRNQQLHNPPITIPTRGNAHIMYRIFFLFHSTFGMGIVENILNDRSSDLKKVIILVLEHCSRNLAIMAPLSFSHQILQSAESVLK